MGTKRCNKRASAVLANAHWMGLSCKPGRPKRRAYGRDAEARRCLRAKLPMYNPHEGHEHAIPGVGSGLPVVPGGTVVQVLLFHRAFSISETWQKAKGHALPNHLKK